MIADALKARKEAAMQELAKLIKDQQAVPINYNHYYTDNVHKKRAERIEAQLKKHVPNNTSSPSTTSRCNLGDHYHKPDTDTKEELERAISKWKDSVTADMEEFSCEESLDCLDAIYKVINSQAISKLTYTCPCTYPHQHTNCFKTKQVQLKVFVANVTTQVIERHLMADLYNIFSPMTVLNMTDAKIQSIVSEPDSTKRQRMFLSDRVKKLGEGQEIFRGFMDN